MEARLALGVKTQRLTRVPLPGRVTDQALENCSPAGLGLSWAPHPPLPSLSSVSPSSAQARGKPEGIVIMH